MQTVYGKLSTKLYALTEHGFHKVETVLKKRIPYYATKKSWVLRKIMDWRWVLANLISPVPLAQHSPLFFQINYYRLGKFYSLKWRHPRRGPKITTIVQAETPDGTFTDVTDEMEPFLGVHGDFHHLPYTPIDFGYSSFHIVKGSQTFVFKEKETISFL
jgi:hypothetical protein